MSKNNRQLVALALLVLILTGLSPHVIVAQTPFNFGGRIAYVDYLSCTCTGVVLTVSSPPKGMSNLLYFWGLSGLYSYYDIWHSGPSVKGTYVPAAGVCLNPCTTGCCYNGQKSLISPWPLGIGTSAGI
ncbi:MAG TPA: hypothetical protein VI953_04755 [Candidatus Paceibacterota bacterium]